MMRKFAVSAVLAVMIAEGAFAANGKWKQLVFTDDISAGLAELENYCIAHDVAASDVLWANNVDSTDIKPGQSLYLPVNHADMLAIWQKKGAWQPTGLAPAMRAEKKKAQLKEVPMPKIAGIPDLQTLSEKSAAKPQPAAKETAEAPEPEPAMTAETKTESADTELPEIAEKSEGKTEKTNDEIIAMLREEVKTDARNLPPEMPEQSELSPHTDTEPVQAAKAEPDPEVKPSPKAKTLRIPAVAKKQKESPAKVIANTAKPDKILTSKRKKTTRIELPGLMDPIIVFSPNGDPTKGPMRLIISGDKVEVVQLPKSAAPKRPSVSDLEDSFGTNPSYLPHYNMTAKQPDPFAFSMRNLSGRMMWPVDGKVSSPFGKWRGSHKHQGIDIPMPAGTPIRAAKNGVIARTGNNSTMGFRGYGNFVLMDHGGGVQTFYAHCLSVAVVPGQRVMQGQVVGYVGNTGRSTANHLHFEVRVNNTKVDPIPYLGGNTSLASRK